jgi:dTDP-4-dehydrorhamnose 3,5-epimerase
MVYVPPYVAHGYVSLVDGCEVSYLTGGRYAPEAERGIRWDDPALSIDWPSFDSLIISEKDRGYPDFRR